MKHSKVKKDVPFDHQVADLRRQLREAKEHIASLERRLRQQQGDW